MASRLRYDTVFASVAVEFFVGQPKRQQRKILDRAHELASDPFLEPDLRSTDASGREVFQFMSDDFIFDYWIDHAAKQVVVTGIEYVE